MTDDELAQDIYRAQQGDQDARNRVIAASYGICRDAAGRVCNEHSLFDDDYQHFVSYGVDGLFRAVRTFQPSADSRSWYWWAYKCARQAIFDWHRYHDREKRRLPDDRIEQQLNAASGDDRELILGDVLPDHRCPYTLCERAEADMLVMRGVLHALSSRDRIIVALYYGLGSEPRNMRQIGSLFGISREAVRQRLKHSLRRLREHLQGPERTTP